VVELLNVNTSWLGEQGEVETAVNPAAPVVVVTVPGAVTGVKGVGAVGPVPVDVPLVPDVELPLPELVPEPEEELPLPEPDVPELLLLVL